MEKKQKLCYLSLSQIGPHYIKTDGTLSSFWVFRGDPASSEEQQGVPCSFWGLE